MATVKDLILAGHQYPKGWYMLYHSKGALKREWLKAAAANDKEKAIKMLKEYSK